MGEKKERERREKQRKKLRNFMFRKKSQNVAGFFPTAFSFFVKNSGLPVQYFRPTSPQLCSRKKPIYARYLWSFYKNRSNMFKNVQI